MKKVIKSVDLLKKEYKVKNYKEFFTFSKNALLSENCVKKVFGYKKTGLKIFQPLDKIFVVGDAVYLFHSGNLYLKTTVNERLLISTGGQEISVTEIISGGKRLPLFVTENGLYLVSGSNAIKNEWVSAKVATEHCGRLFTASDRIITFSEKFDFETQTVPIKVSGSLRVDKDSGNVLGFLSDNEKLFVLCQRAIYLIKTGSDILDFAFRKIRYLQFEIDEKTLVTAHGKAYFISDKKVYSFDGEEFRFHGEYLRALDGYECFGASFLDGTYYLCVKNQTDNYIYACDTTDNFEGLVSVQYAVTSNGCGVIDGELFDFDYSEENLSESVLESKRLYLSSKGQFDLCEISVLFGGSGKLVVYSNCGKKTFTLKDGVNRFRCMLGGEWVKLEFTAEKSCPINNLLLKYVEKGD